MNNKCNMKMRNLKTFKELFSSYHKHFLKNTFPMNGLDYCLTMFHSKKNYNNLNDKTMTKNVDFGHFFLAVLGYNLS